MRRLANLLEQPPQAKWRLSAKHLSYQLFRPEGLCADGDTGA